jgi:hypothetical protein
VPNYFGADRRMFPDHSLGGISLVLPVKKIDRMIGSNIAKTRAEKARRS